MGGGYDSVKTIKGKFSAARYKRQMGCENLDIKSVDMTDLIGMRTRGHILRGAYLDAFARLETAVMEQLLRAKLKESPSAPLCRKLDKLSAASEHFEDPAKLETQIAAIRRLNDARSDIVHAVLTVIVRYDGNKPIGYWFGFQNACDSTKHLRTATDDELKAMAREAMQLAGSFKKQQVATPA